MKIEVRKLDMTYRTGKRALQDINIEMESPNLIGLLGPNGAGKSTLMKLMVAGLLPTSGEIILDGKPLVKNEANLKDRLGYLPQNFGLYDELTVWQFLDYMAALKGIGNDSRQAIQKAIEETNLVEKRNSRISTLSGGQRQRVGIAQAILGEPDLLIFDDLRLDLTPKRGSTFAICFQEVHRIKSCCCPPTS